MCASVSSVFAQDISTNLPLENQNWDWHVQNTDIVQGYPGFSAKYSGPNSLPSVGETPRIGFAGCDGRCSLVARSRGAH
jgi:hypothetical protein